MASKLYLAVFALLSFISLAVLGQKDTAFWFAPPQIDPAHGSFGADIDTPIYVRISSYDQPATITLFLPANPAFTPIVRNVAANSTVTVWLSNLAVKYLETAPADSVLNTGLKISATAPISVYYDAEAIVNPEIFVLKGQNGLGTSFWIPGQNVVSNHPYTGPANNSIDIVATQDSTVVTITPAQAVVGHAAGIAYTKLLNAGQTYSAAATSIQPEGHLQGSTVTSTKPITISVKDDLLDASTVWENGQDLTGDQIVPVTQIGTEYIAVMGDLVYPYDAIFVLATENNTTITQDGNYLTTINAGANYAIYMTNLSTYIQTNNPVYVWQLTGMGGELGSGILPPINCTGSNQVAYVRATADPMYIMLLVQSSGQNNFLFNGNPGVITGSSFTAVPGTGGQWVAAKFDISTAQLAMDSSVVISNSTNLFHAGILNGTLDEGASFGYYSNFNSFLVQPSNNGACNQAIHLQADSVPGAVYSWTGPNGFTSSAVNPVINNPVGQDTGNYTLTVTYNGCSSVSSTDVQLLSTQTPAPNSFDTIICAGDSAQICLPDSFTSYQWNTGSNTACTYAYAAGGYWATVTLAGGCSAISEHYDLKEYPVSSVSVVVKGDTLSSYGAVTYQWYLDGAPIDGATIPFYVAKQPGNYALLVSDTNGCYTLSRDFYVASAGVNDLTTGNVAIYPNPSTGLVFIDYPATGAGNLHLSVFNSLGQLIGSSDLDVTAGKATFDLSPFASGIYILQLQTGNEVLTRRVMKE